MVDLAWAPNPSSRAAVAYAASASCRLEEVAVPRLLQVMARRGRWADCSARLRDHLGAEPPARPSVVQAGATAILWSGPDQVLLLPETRDPDDESRLREVLGNAASISDQSDARIRFRLSGPRARDALAKLCSIDLHPQTFEPGALAQTAVDHTNVSLWRDGDDGFNLLVFSSFADSLWHAVSEAAAEFRR